MPGDSPSQASSLRTPSLLAGGSASLSRSGTSDLSSTGYSPRSRTRSGTEWECVDTLRAGPNPRWRCKSCLTEYTGAPRRIAQHILGAGGVGQIKPCPCPRQEHVTLMTELMSLDAESGRLVKKSRIGDEGGGGGGGGGGGAAASPVRLPRKSKQRSSGSAMPEQFEVFVAKEDFKFSSSHFVAFDGFRERLHGHNYSCGIRLKGQVGGDGYVVDFGVVKKAMRKLCKELNERFLCPMESDALDISITGSQMVMVCQDGATYVLPRDDCALLPLVHSTTEELAYHLYVRLLREFSLPYLHSRGVTDMEVSVAEMPHQEATYRGKIPMSEDQIRDPPYREFRRVEGCFSRDNDDDFGASSGSGNINNAGSSNNNNNTGNVTSSSSSASNKHGMGSSRFSSSGGGGGGWEIQEEEEVGGGMDNMNSSSSSPHSCSPANVSPNPSQLSQGYPYGNFLGMDNSSNWGSAGSSGGRMRLGGAGGGGGLTGTEGGALDVLAGGMLPGLRQGSGSMGQGVVGSPRLTGTGVMLGLGGHDLPLGPDSRGM